MKVFRRSGYALFSLLLIAPGCNQRDDLGQVSGRVTLDGEPLPGAAVEFSPLGPGSTSYGMTDDGNYSMTFSRHVKGASLGESVVRITTRDVYGEEGREKWKPEKVPPQYNRKSELKVTVEPGRNRFDFDLETSGEG